MIKDATKIIPLKDISSYKIYFQGKKTVLVGGCFDLLHYGHYSFLEKSKEIGECLIVALESDEFIKRRKDRDPIHSQKERAEILAGLNIVDYVILLPYFSSDKEYEELVKKVRPYVIAITEGDSQIGNKQKQARLVGGILKIVSPVLGGFATKKIIEKLL